MSEFEQLFADPRDTQLDECMLEELYYSSFARHPLHIFDNTVDADLYGDPLSEKNLYPTTVTIPMLIKTDPEEEDLSKYGYDRTREFIIWFSRKILHDNGVNPKVGDRIDFTYRSPVGTIINEHIIINEVSPVDFVRSTIDHISISAAGNRTQKRYNPNPGSPADPDPIALDVKYLKNM